MQTEAAVRTREQSEICQTAPVQYSHTTKQYGELDPGWQQSRGRVGIRLQWDQWKTLLVGHLQKKRYIFIDKNWQFKVSKWKTGQLYDKQRRGQDCSAVKKDSAGTIGCRLCLVCLAPQFLVSLTVQEAGISNHHLFAALCDPQPSSLHTIPLQGSL